MISLLGDSHSNLFKMIPGVIQFNTLSLNLDLVTIYRLLNKEDTDIQTKVHSWLLHQSLYSKCLIVSTGEVDIRAHFWRHIPRNYNGSEDIENFIKLKSLEYFNFLVSLANTYGFEKIIIWGAPTSQEKAMYNSSYPFAGSASIRNKLIHLWNKFLYEYTKTDSRIIITTAFYEFIDPVSYSTLPSIPSQDGVHWNSNLSSSFWKQFILPAIHENISIINKNWRDMLNHKFEISEIISDGRFQYDSWVDSSYISNLNSRQTTVNKKDYYWVTADKRNQLPEQYKELSLTIL